MTSYEGDVFLCLVKQQQNIIEKQKTVIDEALTEIKKLRNELTVPSYSRISPYKGPNITFVSGMQILCTSDRVPKRKR